MSSASTASHLILPKRKPTGAEARHEHVRELADSLAKFLLVSEGIDCRGRAERDLSEFFRQLSETQQAKAVSAMEEYFETCLTVAAAGKSLRNHKEAVQAHLLRHRVRIDEEVAGILDRHECVELYDFHLVQTYRSPNFLKFTDRSLEELAILPYYMMYTRSEKISDRCITNCMAMLTRSHEGPMWDFLERHIVKEKGSARVSSVNTIVASPIYSERSGEVMGLIHVFDIEAHTEIKLMN